MTVYLEYILLDNLAADLFLLYISFFIRKKQTAFFRLFLSALIGAFFSVLYPFIGKWNYAVKVLLPPAMMLAASRYKSAADFTAALAVFLLCSLALAGAAVLLSSFSDVDLTEYNAKIQLFPFCVCGSCLLIAVLSKICVNELYKRRNRLASELTALVLLANGEKEKCAALYDSGNLVYEPLTGKPMAVISRRLFERIGGQTDGEVLVRTVGGVMPLLTTKLSFEIYSADGGNKIYMVPAAVSRELYSEYDIILHSDMTGE